MVMKNSEKIEINEKNPKRLVAVYGTLREGHGNWQYRLKGRATKLGTYQTDPTYHMYNTGGFPIVTPNGDTAIEYEVYEVTDNDTLNGLHSLEGCTGIPGNPQNWYDIQPIQTPHGTAYMYMQYGGKGLPLVKSGNWNQK